MSAQINTPDTCERLNNLGELSLAHAAGVGEEEHAEGPAQVVELRLEPRLGILLCWRERE